MKVPNVYIIILKELQNIYFAKNLRDGVDSASRGRQMALNKGTNPNEVNHPSSKSSKNALRFLFYSEG